MFLRAVPNLIYSFMNQTHGDSKRLGWKRKLFCWNLWKRNDVWVVKRTFLEKQDLHFENKCPCFTFFDLKKFFLYFSSTLTAGEHYPAWMFSFPAIISKQWSKDRPENAFWTTTSLSVFQRPWKFYWSMSEGINKSIFY